MGEQARRPRTSGQEDFVHRSIHEAVAWHRDMRGRYRARKCAATIYASVTEPRIRRPNPEREAFRAEAAAIRNAKLALIAELQGGRCYLCPEPFSRIWSPTMDHVVPRVLGGAHIGNILAAHRICNQRKGGRAPYACEVLFLEVVNEQMREPASFDRIDEVAPRVA